MSPHARTTRDARAIEIATATERALQAHEQTCREREERRQDQAAEFRDEIRLVLAELRTGLREVGTTIERLQSRIMTALLSAVVSLLGLSGWLATKLLGW
ncbi:MAG TPA: hypothetical protein VIR38_13335 [Thalassobaculum sp.]